MTSEKPESIQWVEKNVRLDQLRPYERNPRSITDIQYQKLKKSIKEDGYHNRIKATQDLLVIGGHQRLKAMKELGYDEITILVPDRPIPHKQFERILIRDNVNNGLFDMDMLANDFDLEELRDWGVHEIMDIMPEDKATDSDDGGGSDTEVICPECKHQFGVKGNKT